VHEAILSKQVFLGRLACLAPYFHMGAYIPRTC